MANLSKEDVLKLASLSKLELSDEQLSHFTPELEAILEHIEKLQAVDVDGLEPTNQVSGLVNVMREDEIREYANQAELLKNVPAVKDNQIKVKRVLG
jgi:aspartyl-tRNA(Asn)/glutamyl-tRNA(Gln) amidotransferase subunit C